MNIKPIRRSKEGGAALAAGLFFLLILTIIGLTAVRSTTLQARMAANYQFQTIAFQGAESVIRVVLGELRGDIPRPTGITISLIEDALDGGATDPFRDYTGSAGVTSRATLTFMPGGVLEDHSILGGSSALRFSIRAQSVVANTNAQAEHEQGILRVAPSVGY